jgi:hypothetical protein
LIVSGRSRPAASTHVKDCIDDTPFRFAAPPPASRPWRRSIAARAPIAEKRRLGAFARISVLAMVHFLMSLAPWWRLCWPSRWRLRRLDEGGVRASGLAVRGSRPVYGRVPGRRVHRDLLRHGRRLVIATSSKWGVAQFRSQMHKNAFIVGVLGLTEYKVAARLFVRHALPSDPALAPADGAG